MKIYAYRFCKTNNRNKAQPIFLMGRDLWMRCAHKNETRKIFFCLDCTDFAVFLCICLFKVPAPGPWKSCLHLCPTSLGAFWFPWLCWGSFLPFSKAHILCTYCEPAFGLCMGITFPWNLSASFLSLPATHCRVCSSWRQAATSGCSLTGAWLPLMGKYRECFLTLNNFCKFCNLKYPEESCLHLSRSTAEVLSR